MTKSKVVREYIEMGGKYTKSLCGVTSRRMGTHGKHEVDSRIMQGQSRGKQDQAWPNASVNDDDNAH